MDCKIQFDKQGNKNGVLENNELFQQILNIPTTKDFSEAIEIFKQTYSDKIRYSIIGEIGASNLDQEEVGYRIDNLMVAKEMELAGKTAKEIKIATGWERGISKFKGKWKYEVSDGVLNFSKVERQNDNTFIINFKDFYSNSEVIKAYKDELNIKVVFDKNLESEGLFKDNIIYIKADIDTNIDEEQIKKVFLHELMHKIQDIEGFQKGGNPSTAFYDLNLLTNGRVNIDKVFNYIDTETKKLKDRKETIAKEVWDSLNKGISYDKNRADSTPTKDEYEKAGKLEEQNKILYELGVLSKWRMYPTSTTFSYNYYLRLAGEVEARNVERRVNLTDNQRREILLSETEDIAREDQILLKDDLNQPQLSYKLNEKFYPNYTQALRASNGEQIEIGVQTVNGFVPLVTAETNTSADRKEGIINGLIKAKLLSGESYLDTKGRKIYKVEGKSLEKRIINTEIAKKHARQYQGVKVKSLIGGDLYFDETIDKDKIEITKKDGTKEVVKKKDLEALTFKQMEAKFEDPIGVLASVEFKNAIPTYSDVGVQDTTKITPENELQEKLVGLLKKMGVKTLDMQTYIDNYAKKNGVEPSASALADLTEKIIAFRDGIINPSDLNEEVAHFIIASTPTAEIENLLRNIHKTSEWLQYSKTYMEIYGDEALVREEILGKVLANSLQRNFETKETTSNTEVSILNKMIDIVNNFFNRINAYFKSEFKTELDGYLDSVYANLMQDKLYESLDMTKFDNRKATLFSVDVSKRDVLTQLYNKSAEAISNINAQQQQLSRKGGSSLARQQINEARELLKKEDETSKVQAMTTMALIAKKQVDRLEKAIQKKKENEFPFSQEENSVYELFRNSTVQILSEVNALIGEQENSNTYKTIKDSIKDTLSKFEEVRGAVGVKDSNAILSLVDNLEVKHNLTPQQKENLLKAIKVSQKDTNTLHAYLGGLTSARSPLLNLAGDVIATTSYQGRQTALASIKPFLQRLEDLKATPKEIKSLIKDEYLSNDIDNKKLEDFQQRVRELSYKSVTNLEYSEEGYKNMSLKDAREVEKSVKDIMSEVKEQFFTDEYINEQEKLFEAIPDVALDFHKKDRAQRAEIRARATKNGVTIYDQTDKVELEELTKLRNQSANYYYPNGELKQGLKKELNSEGKYDVSIDINSPHKDGNTAWGLNKISEIIREKVQDGAIEQGLPQSFLEQYNSLQGQEQLDFLFLNAYVGFNDEFWDNFGEKETIFSKLNSIKTAENEVEINELMDSILVAQQKIAYIQKSNRTFNQPAETNVSSMDVEERNTIKEATQDLEYLYSRANLLLPKEDRVETEKLFDTTPNQAFRDEVEDRELSKNSEVLDFILKNVTDNNKRNINIAIDVANKLKASQPTKIPSNLKSVFAEGVDVDVALMEYAQSKLLPYYKRTEPQGYTELLEQLKANQITLEQFANDSRVKVNPNFSFYDNVSNTNVNPRFLENKEQGRLQIKKGEITLKNSLVAGEKISFDNKDFEQIKNNKRLYDIWSTFTEIQKATLDNYGISETHNIFKLPQIGKRGFRQTQDVIQKVTSPKVWKEVLDELLTFREDESEFGQDYEGKSASRLMSSNVIPMYYTRDLTNKDDLSDELIYTYTLMNQQSALYKARVDNLGDMLAVKKAIEDTTFEKTSAQASNTYKMFKSFMDYNFFGIKENLEYSKELPFVGRVDLAKVLQKFIKFTSFTNLSGITVPLTNFAQNKAQKTVERIVGERFDGTARRLGNQEAKRIMSSYVGAMMNINAKDDGTIIMETFGQDNIVEDKLKNTSFSKFTRGLGKLPNIANELFSIPIKLPIVLTVLNDNRYVNGKILTFNQYKTLNRTKDLKQLKIDWEKKALVYADREFKDGQFRINLQKASTNLNMSEEETAKYLSTFMEGLNSRIRTTVNDIDLAIPQEEKSILGRNAMANVILMHRGWLLTASQRRFSSGHLNLSTGMWEEGIYSTLGRFVKDITSGALKKNGATYLQHVRNMWQGENLKNEDGTIDLDRLDNQKRNLIRVGAELAVINGMFAIGMLLASFHEDDDEKRNALDELVDIAYYFTYRATNEVASGSTLLPAQYYGVAKSPVISLQMMNNIAMSYNIFNGEEIKTGSFKGFTKREKTFISLTPYAKDIVRLTNIQKATNDYKHFNDQYEKVVALSFLAGEKEE